MRLPLSRFSFRWQITVLGASAVVLLLGVLAGTLTAFHYRAPGWTSSVLNTEGAYLFATAHQLAYAYEQSYAASGDNSKLITGNLPAANLKDGLLSLADSTLNDKDGVYGGFYISSTDNVVTYPSSSRASSETKTSDSFLHPEERNEILSVARTVSATGAPLDRMITIDQEYLLINAVPVRGGGSVGSAWVVRRLPVIPGSNRFRAYMLAAGLGAAALACVILTLLVVGNLQSGVRKIETGLQGLESSLASRVSAETDPDEIRRIAEAINRLGATLRENLEREKHIEDRLRHAERLAALGRLVAGVAHEVRNPLATIRLRVQMCQRAAGNLEVFESCAVALEEIERLNGMVNRLLSFSQPVQLHAEPSNLCRLVEQRLEIFREKAQHAGIRFVTDFSDTGATLQVDRGRIAQVFDNTIQNAMDAMSDSGGTLWVSILREAKTSTGAEAVCAEFRDTGKGMGPEVINRIFDPFFTTKAFGTGLGLSISHELVRAHGGEIQVDSIEGRGTTLRILLPLGREEVMA